MKCRTLFTISGYWRFTVLCSVKATQFGNNLLCSGQVAISRGREGCEYHLFLLQKHTHFKSWREKMLHDWSVKTVILPSSSASLGSSTHAGSLLHLLLCLAHLKGIRTRHSKIIFSRKVQLVIWGQHDTGSYSILHSTKDSSGTCSSCDLPYPKLDTWAKLSCVPWQQRNKHGLIPVLHVLHNTPMLSFHIHIFFCGRCGWKNSIRENAASKFSVISRVEVSKHPPHFKNTT